MRRYYRLTPAGAERLAVELDRLRVHTAVAARRLNLAGAWHERVRQTEGPLRGLLAPYPAEHWSVHEDEMLGQRDCGEGGTVNAEVMPPSRGKAAPVTNPESSLAR